jgi:hypothetical protein
MRGIHSLSLLLLALAPVASVSAQPASLPGYVVASRSPQQVLTAPAGWVGRKTIDSERRVSNSDHTRGTEAVLTLTFGGFARACPTADGVVDGTFEYSLTSEVKTVPEPGQLVRRYSRQLVAQLRGEVGENARLKQVEMFGSWSIETRESGTSPSLQTIPVRQTFRPSSSGEPDWHAMQSAVASTADVAVAAVILWAGEFYTEAETNWTKLNECVEFAFDPPSGTRSLGPNESAQVRVELQTKAGRLPVPWTTSNIGAIGGGTVSPRPAQAPAAAPSATLTYTASSQPRRGHGIDLATTSRAGVAGGRWAISERGRHEWSGTITVIETTITQSSGEGDGGRGAHTQQETETEELTVTVTNGGAGSGSDALASLSGRAEGQYQRLQTYAGWVTRSCGAAVDRKLNNTTRETWTGSASGDASIFVELSGDGTYIIGSTSSDVVMTITREVSGQAEVFGPGCAITIRPDSREPARDQHRLGVLARATGTIDPKTPDVLAGSKKEDLSPPPVPDSRSSVTRTRTTTWQFRRQ